MSLGADHVVKVWDLRNQKCLQTIAPKDWGVAAVEDSHPTCMAYDASRQRLVSAVSPAAACCLRVPARAAAPPPGALCAVSAALQAVR